MSKKIRSMVQLGMLIAIELALTFTPLGFLRIGPMTVTLMHIPVLIGAIILGPTPGMLLGLVFGIASIINANLIGTPDVMPFSPFLSGSAWSLVVAILPRVIFPLIAAWLFRLLKQTGLSKPISAGISAGVGTFCHTLLVLSSVYFLLGTLYANALKIPLTALKGMFLGIISYNGLIEAGISILICSVLAVPLLRITQKE